MTQPSIWAPHFPSSSKVMGRQYGQNTPTTISSVPITRLSASVGTSEASVDTQVLIKMNTHTSAPSVVNATIPSHGLDACNPQIDTFVQTEHSLHLNYSDFSSYFIPRPSLSCTSLEDSHPFNRILHPYNTDTFKFLLCKHGLFDSYPLLPFNLHCGFTIGYMPSLCQTDIMPNNPSILSYPG